MVRVLSHLNNYQRRNKQHIKQQLYKDIFSVFNYNFYKTTSFQLQSDTIKNKDTKVINVICYKILL